MKNFFITSTMNCVTKYYEYDEDKLEELKYGFEVLYITITKTIVVFSIAYFLNLLNTLLWFFLFYTLLRLTGFGIHAKKSWQCWISSILIFNFIPFICQYSYIPILIKLFFSIISIILIALYAPADTEKRPIINKKVRRNYKISCVMIALIYSVALLFVQNQIISNTLLMSNLLMSIVILPITYKVFNLPYNNYKNYLVKETKGKEIR